MKITLKKKCKNYDDSKDMCLDNIKEGQKTKSLKQVGYLLSDGSPLNNNQKIKLKKELHSGKVKIKK